MYYNLFLFTTVSFHLFVYNINVTFSATLMYSNLFRFTTGSFHFLICNINITFSTTHTNYIIFFFTNACFNPLCYARIKMLIGCVTCCLTCLGCFIHKTDFFWIRLRSTFLYFVSGHFFSVQFFNFRCTLLYQLIFYDCIYQTIYSLKYDPSRRLNVRCMKSKNIWLRFIASQFRTSMSYLSQLRSILYCVNNTSLLAISMHGTPI